MIWPTGFHYYYDVHSTEPSPIPVDQPQASEALIPKASSLASELVRLSSKSLFSMMTSHSSTKTGCLSQRFSWTVCPFSKWLDWASSSSNRACKTSKAPDLKLHKSFGYLLTQNFWPLTFSWPWHASSDCSIDLIEGVIKDQISGIPVSTTQELSNSLGQDTSSSWKVV